MVLTAIEFLGLAFFLGMIAGAVLEQLARPRPNSPLAADRDAIRDESALPGPLQQLPSCSFCGAIMQPMEEQIWSDDHQNSTWVRRGFECLSCGQERRCS